VRTALERLAGVAKAEVTYRPGRAVVHYDPAKITVEQMVEAVRKAGFQARRLDVRPGG
jgi:copper chaperone CopZ